jgi:hypothetical protein
MHGGDEKCKQNFGWKASIEEITWTPGHRLEDNIKMDLKK